MCEQTNIPELYDCINEYPYESASKTVLEKLGEFSISAACSIGVGGGITAVLDAYDSHPNISVGIGMLGCIGMDRLIRYITTSGKPISI
jgi:hypothetical protein